MRIGRTLPPAAAPIGWRAFFNGLLGILSGKKEIERFEKELKEYFGKKHCFLVSSGKAALTLILLTLKEQYPERDEVLIPAYTCYSVPSAIVRAGLKVKLCDLAENSFDFDFEQLAPMLKSEKLLAVLPTHLFGLPADVKRLRGMINNPEVTVIEDAAQAMGGEWQGEKLGTLSDVGFFSLGRGKAFSTVEGGIILTDHDELAATLKPQVSEIPDYTHFEVLKLLLYTIALNILIYPAFFWLPKGLPFLKLGETVFDPDFELKKLSSFQAGLAKNWVERLRLFQQVRQANTRKWFSVLDATSCEICLPKQGDFPDMIRLPVEIEDEKYRAEILKLASNAGFGISVAYPAALCDVRELAGMFNNQDFPTAKQHARSLVTFPLHPFVSREDLNRIISGLKNI